MGEGLEHTKRPPETDSGNAAPGTPGERDLLTLNRTYHVAQSNMELLPNYYGWMCATIRPYLRGTVVELGCGAGLGIAHYLERVDRVIATDFNEELLGRVRERYRDAPVEARCVDLIDGGDELVGVDADAVLMMDVVEHFKDDGTLIRRAARFLKPGGHLCVKVPAGRHLYSDLDRASGHFRRYDRDDIDRLAADSGLELAVVRPMNVLGAIAYRLKSRRPRQSNFSSTFAPWHLRAVNRLIPAIRMVDTARFLPGLSWIAVYRKP